jgi:chorismate-pyruvate lyase
MKKRPQMSLPKTLPPRIRAESEWLAAMADVEEHEANVDAKEAALKQAREDLAEAEKTKRGREMVYREVLNEETHRQGAVS